MPSTILMPALSPTMTEGTIVKWLVKEGDKVEEGDGLCEIQTDKATIEFEAIDGGYIRKIVVKEGSVAEVNQGIAILHANLEDKIDDYQLEEKIKKAPVAKKAAEEKAPEKKEQVATTTMSAVAFEPVEPPKIKKETASAQLMASPLAKKIAQEKGLDLSSVQGSGPHGRVVEKDLVNAQKLGPVSFASTGKPSGEPGTYNQIPLTPIRKVIGSRLLASKVGIPHYYLTMEVEMSRVLDQRVQLKEMGLKVTVNDFIIKAAALALKENPSLNSGFNSKEDKIIEFHSIDISLAVDIPDGLITPVIWQADALNLGEISFEAKRLATKAREGKLAPEEYQGGSFTISNLGMFGIDHFTAVINPPQAAILAVGGVKEVLVMRDSQLTTIKQMHLTLSADHRVVDGANAARFLVSVKKFLENPAALLI